MRFITKIKVQKCAISNFMNLPVTIKFRSFLAWRQPIFGQFRRLLFNYLRGVHRERRYFMRSPAAYSGGLHAFALGLFHTFHVLLDWDVLAVLLGAKAKDVLSGAVHHVVVPAALVAVRVAVDELAG